MSFPQERRGVADRAEGSAGGSRPGRGRRLTGWLLAVAGPPALTLLLTSTRGAYGPPTELMLFLALAVLVALVGGLWPALVSAVLGTLLASYWFTSPHRTWTVADAEDVLALAVFVLVAAAVSTVVELAARRAAQAARSERAAEAHRLEQAVAIRTALLAAVSHDLRTPLSAIKAGVSSLRQDDVDWEPADEAELLATVEDSADRLERLIDNLLDLSRLQTGAVQPLLQPIGLDEVVPLALEGVRPGAVAVDVAESLPRVVADAGLLERVVANLVENAVTHAAGPPGAVRVEARGRDGVVELRVVDHGPGVPAAARAGMFMPFQRVGDIPAGTGVGLGLAVARGFAEAMNGTLVAEDTAGGGLTMVLSLPAAGDPAGSGRRT